jgi:hypothetical protein
MFIPDQNYGVPIWLVNITTPLTIMITASHGIVVSILYCFTSNEVKLALQRRWRLHRELQGIYNEISSRRPSRDSTTHRHDKLSLSGIFQRFSLTERGSGRNSLARNRSGVFAPHPGKMSTLIENSSEENSRKETFIKICLNSRELTESDPLKSEERYSTESKDSKDTSVSGYYSSIQPDTARNSHERRGSNERKDLFEDI